MFMSLLKDSYLLLNDNFLAIDNVDALAQSLGILGIFAYQLTIHIIDVTIYVGIVCVNEVDTCDAAIHALGGKNCQMKP